MVCALQDPLQGIARGRRAGKDGDQSRKPHAVSWALA